jgi:hypothetical protein
MDARFYRAQAELCRRIGEALPQERIAAEVIKLALEFDSIADALETPLRPARDTKKRAVG